jgi:transposase
MRRSLLLVAAILGLSLAGCQQALQKSEEALEAKICENLTAVGKALEQVAALQPTSTVGQATAANQALTRSLEALNRSEALLEKLRLREFRNQLSAFNKEASRIASNKKLTLEEAAAELKTKAEPVIAARRQVSERVKCPRN